MFRYSRDATRNLHAHRSTPRHGVSVLLAVMAVAMLAVASQIEQPPIQVPVDLGMSIAAND